MRPNGRKNNSYQGSRDSELTRVEEVAHVCAKVTSGIICSFILTKKVLSSTCKTILFRFYLCHPDTLFRTTWKLSTQNLDHVFRIKNTIRVFIDVN